MNLQTRLEKVWILAAAVIGVGVVGITTFLLWAGDELRSSSPLLMREREIEASVEGSLPPDRENGVDFCSHFFDRREVRVACRNVGYDLKPLARLVYVRELVLVEPWPNLNVLRKLTDLRSLQVWGATRGIRGVEAAAGLETLRLDHPGTWAVAHVLKHADMFPKLRSLRVIWHASDFWGRPFVYRMDKLRALRHLEELEISVGEVRDFRALYDLPKLRRLRLDRMRILNVEELSLIRSLRRVSMFLPEVSLRALDELQWMRPDIEFDIRDAYELGQGAHL